MKKQTKVLAAAALFTLGASFSAMAAKKGTWALEDGEWYCYDSDGDVIENEFCLSNGKEYYVGDDGTLVCNEWVEDDGDYYYVNSAGEKVKNEWRYLTPYDNDDEEEEWFYFKSNGKRAEDEKLVINGKTYFFNNDGEMLTGWIQENAGSYDEASTDAVKEVTTYYCGEDGARLSKEWVWDYAPSVDQDDISSDDEEHWYYIKSSGKPATGKQASIGNETYFFDNEGIMLTGWVAAFTDSNAKTYYDIIWNDDDDTDGTYGSSLRNYADTDVYFAKEDGHMKKNTWVKTYNNVQFGEDDSDNDEFWFYINSTGKVYIPETVDSAAARYDFDDADEKTWEDAFSVDAYDNHTSKAFNGTWKKINSKTYLFDEDGQMLSNFVKFTNGDVYYFGGWDDGARKDGSQTVSDDAGQSHRFYFATDDKTQDGYYNAVGVTGAKNGKLYNNGMLVKALDNKYEEKTVTVTYVENNTTKTVEAKFIVNKSGTIQSSAKDYEEDDDVVASSKGKVLYDGGVAALKNSVWAQNDVFWRNN